MTIWTDQLGNTSPTPWAGSYAGVSAASNVSNTPAGGIAATNVQAAIDELDTEKQSVLVNSAGLAAALNDETGTGSVVFSSGATLTGATLTGATLTGATLTALTLAWRNVANTFTGALISAITAARTWTFPDLDGTVVLREGTETITGAKTMTGANAFNGTLGATTRATVQGTTGDFNSTLNATGAATLGGGLAVTGSISATLTPTGTLTPPVFARVVRTAGDITTTSTSLVDVTGATVTFTTGAFPVAYGVAQTVLHDTLNVRTTYNIAIDGAMQIGTSGLRYNEYTAGAPFNGSFSGQSAALTAASHTIKELWMVDLGTGTIVASTANAHLFYAREIR